jgi:hypothetical protein
LKLKRATFCNNDNTDIAIFWNHDREFDRPVTTVLIHSVQSIPCTAGRLTNFQKRVHVSDNLTTQDVLLFVRILQMITNRASVIPAFPSFKKKKKAFVIEGFHKGGARFGAERLPCSAHSTASVAATTRAVSKTCTFGGKLQRKVGGFYILYLK